AQFERAAKLERQCLDQRAHQERSNDVDEERRPGKSRTDHPAAETDVDEMARSRADRSASRRIQQKLHGIAALRPQLSVGRLSKRPPMNQPIVHPIIRPARLLSM